MPARRHSPTGPLTVVLVADSKSVIWLLKWLYEVVACDQMKGEVLSLFEGC